MENNYFDDWIKKELDEYEVPLQPEDWGLMEDRLDKDFDDWVKEGIEDSPPVFGGSDWGEMEKRLDEEDKFQERYFIVKGLEVLILALVLMTVSQYIPFGNNAYSIQPSMDAPIEQIERNVPQPVLEDDKDIEGPEAPAVIPETELEAAPSEAIYASKSASKILTRGTQTENVASIDPAQDASLSTLNISNRIVEKDFEDGQKQLMSEDEILVAIENGKIELPNSAVIPDNEKATLKTNHLLAVDLLQNAKDIAPLDIVGSRDIQALKSKARLRLGMYVSPDVNMVFTPYSEKIRDSYQSINTGFSGGFTIGFSKDRWETETGLEYALITYKPKPVIEIKGSVQENFYAETLKDIEFNLVSIPLNFSYNFLYHKGWKFYAKSGATFNVVALSKFYQRQDILSAPLVSELDVPISAVQRPGADRQGGLFVDRTFKDNYFVTANFGLGAERLLTNNFSVFVEPSFSHTIHGAKIGPNNDKINTVSFNMGAKITL